jgi:hypothetical protein
MGWAYTSSIRPNKVHVQDTRSSINTLLNAPCKVRTYLITTYNPNSAIDLSVGVLVGALPPPLELALLILPGRRSALLFRHRRQVGSQQWCRMWGTQQKACSPLLSTMLFSTWHRDYNDPSVQDLGDGQQGDGSDPPGGSQPFNLEVEFHKLHKLVKTQA